jgi:hypothetical protein
MRSRLDRWVNVDLSAKFLIPVEQSPLATEQDPKIARLHALDVKMQHKGNTYTVILLFFPELRRGWPAKEHAQK